MLLVQTIATVLLALVWISACWDGGPGGRIVFASERDGVLGLYTMNADGSDVTKLTDLDEGVWSLDISTDGQRIAFFTYRDGSYGIYMMNANGSGVTKVIDINEYVKDLDLSPDGRRIAYTLLYQGNREQDIFVIDTDGSGLAQLTNCPLADISPVWSPDGQRIAFTSDRRGEGGEIYVMDADGSNLTRLADAYGSNPTRSPKDDRSCVTPSVFVTSQSSDVVSSWSPDGRLIAFMHSTPTLGHHLYVMDADGTKVTQLTGNLLPPAGTYIPSPSEPVWSPDGRWIALTSYRNENRDVFVVRADGSDATRLTDHPALDRVIAWIDPYRTASTSGSGDAPTATVAPAAATAPPAASGSVETDREALVAFYNATNGENWYASDNWLSDAPLGEWDGVTTDDDGRVTELTPVNNGLSGEIPAELGSLSNLINLALYDNELSGEIPAELGSLSNLTTLYLHYNDLSGCAPSSLEDQLTTSNLGGLPFCQSHAPSAGDGQ